METRADVKKGWDKWAAERMATSKDDDSFWCPDFNIPSCIPLRDNEGKCDACYDADHGEKENP